MAEITLRVLPKDHSGPVRPGDVYYADFIKDWIVVLPLPEPGRDVHFALNTCASSCPHGRRDYHRCWEVTGDDALASGDASKLTLRPSILVEYDPGKSIHGYITNGKWQDC